MEDGPPRFPPDFSCLAVLRIPPAASDFRIRGSHPVSLSFPADSASLPQCLCGGPTTPNQKPDSVWALPRSLAATRGVSIDFLSCGYLDVSVPRVGPACAVMVDRPLGFPIRTSSDRRVLARSPKLFAGSCVLHRLLLPRHPPCALPYFISRDTRSPVPHDLSATRRTRRLPVHPSSHCKRTKTEFGP